jgi:ABC-2 family transporter
MTALTMPTRPARDTHLRPVPWRRMLWVTWRQHRAALTGIAVLLGAFAVYLWLTGLQLHRAYATYCHPANSFACQATFSGKYGPVAVVVSIFLQAVPALIGAFIGAPVLAREMETGTFRYTWTQGIGRWRWTLGKLVPLAVAVTATTGALSALFSWYNQPFISAGYTIPLATRLFNLTGIAFAAWTLAAFAIGVLAGMLIRRAVPAIAATLAVYTGLALATALVLRGHYLTPVHTNALTLPSSAWAVNQWYTKDGTFAFTSHGSGVVSAVRALCPNSIGGSDPSTMQPPAQCLSQHGYTLWTSYQPGSRFWPFQWIEGGWLLALSMLLIVTTVWLVRRRAS